MRLFRLLVSQIATILVAIGYDGDYVFTIRAVKCAAVFNGSEYVVV